MRNIVVEGHNVFITGQGGTGKSFLVKEIYKELTRSVKRVAIICSSGIAGKRRFFLDSYISNKTGCLVTRQTILFLRSWNVYFPLEFEFRGKSCVEREHGGEDSYLVYYYCI